MKKIVCVVLFLMMGVAAQAQAGQIADALADYARSAAADSELVQLNALCTPMDVTLPGPYGGTARITGSFCGKTGNFDIIYTDYQGAPGLVCNGTVQAGLEFDSLANPTAIDISIDGGPLDYTYEGQVYTVYYDNVVARLDLVSLTLTALSGNVVINNLTIPLDDALADLLIL